MAELAHFEWMQSGVKSRIFYAVCEGYYTPTKLADELEISLPAVQRQLTELEKIGILQHLAKKDDARVQGYFPIWKNVARIWCSFAKEDMLNSASRDWGKESMKKLNMDKSHGFLQDLDKLVQNKRFVEFTKVYLKNCAHIMPHFTLHENIINFWRIYDRYLKDKKEFAFLTPLLHYEKVLNGETIRPFGIFTKAAQHDGWLQEKLIKDFRA